MRETRVRVKVFPDARREVFETIDDATFRAFVREPPRNNLANRRVHALVAEHFNTDARNVSLETGRRGPIKTFRIIG